MLIAVYEILASGSFTPIIDSSTPAAVNETSSHAALTTASFTPPAGAVLVAIINGYDFPGSVTISDSVGLTWTRRDTGTDGSVGIYTATAPTGRGSITSSCGLALPGSGFAASGGETFAATGGLALPGPAFEAAGAGGNTTTSGGLALPGRRWPRPGRPAPQGSPPAAGSRCPAQEWPQRLQAATPQPRVG